MKKISDLKLSFVSGLLLYAINSLLNSSNPGAPLPIWITANAFSAITHILLMFAVIKALKWIIKIAISLMK